MIKPDIPDNEVERIHALRALKILDTAHEERFDRVTRMAKRLFNVEISLVSLVDSDRQWFKSAQGLAATETPRDISFCGHAINHNGLFLIPNALEDERFFDNPLVTEAPKIRFYAGYPLKLRQGIKIGTLCLIDSKPKYMDEEEQQLFNDFGAMIEQEIRSIQMATLDELTLVSNRRGFLALADHFQSSCQREQVSMSLILFDLNQVKPINDNFGHHEGDFALKQFAEVLRSVYRKNDIIGRLGGNEFVVMLADVGQELIDYLLGRFKTEMDALNKTINKPYVIEYSTGLARFAHDTELSLEGMIAEADAAMSRSKKGISR